MNEKQFKLWVAELPTLTDTQLKSLATRFKLLSKSNSSPHVGKSDFSDRVLQCVCLTMIKHKVETPSVNVLRKSAAYAQAKDKIADLKNFIEPLSKSKLIQDAILKEGIPLLYTDLISWIGVSVSSHTILQQIHRIPASLHRAYPGYVASGLLHLIVKGS